MNLKMFAETAVWAASRQESLYLSNVFTWCQYASHFQILLTYTASLAIQTANVGCVWGFHIRLGIL